MPPALQMHSHPVPPLSTLSALAGNLPIRDSDFNNDANAASPRPGPSQEFPSPYRRCLPIRASQLPSQQQVPAARLSLPSTEHRLRRKTPNGTVDAGYDGSPSSISSGPPPLKHIIIAASAAGVEPLVTPGAPSHLHGQPWPGCLLVPGHAQNAAVQANSLPVSPWTSTAPSSTPRHGSLHLSSGNIQPGVPGFHREPPYFGLNMYQPFLRAKEYNVRAVCPPPMPTNGHLPIGHIPWQQGSLPRDCSTSEHPQVHALSHRPPNHSSISHPVLCHLAEQVSPGSLDCMRATGGAHHVIEPALADLSVRDKALASSTPEPYIRRAPGRIGQAGFKEKTLVHAHKCYLDLLAFLQANGRGHASKSSSGAGTTYKLPAYPKPRRTESGLSHAPRGSDPAGGGVSLLGSSATGNRYSSDLFMKGLDGQCGPHPRRSSLPGSRQLDMTAGKQYTAPGSSTLLINNSSGVRATPLNNATASLEVLTSLCEQCGWKWLDGLLLGGCLHYGLERYELALTWFSTILEIDSSHVEAITNMAATMFCLNRQTEAEQLWLKAVKLRPSYLEATEHLVGLLYKRRSSEAVEVISYIQRALRISPQRGHGCSHAEDHSYGLSGYALPASENARILALVHAKGTMLYSLKDAEKASEAFEEAVLISVGRHLNGIQDLIRRVQAVLSPVEPSTVGSEDRAGRLLMLPPERARRTAQLVFSGAGELPGLFFIRNAASKRAAIQTTSNSLLSLAKIFQDAMSNGSTNPAHARNASGVGDILALYYLSLSLQESPSTANNVGILLAGIQQTAPWSCKTPIRDFPQASLPGITPGSGMALALEYYNYGLRLDSKHVHLHTNLGSLLKDLGQLDLAIQMYERAVSCDGMFDIALTNLANAVKDKGRINDAIAYYQRAVASNPDFAEAVCGLFTALNSVCSWRGRGGVILASGRYDRWHVDDEGKLVDARASCSASGLAGRVVDIVAQQLRDASCWGQNVLQGPIVHSLAQQLKYLCEDKSFQLDEAIRQWAGKPWEGSRVIRLVERATRVALRRWYLDLHVDGVQTNMPYARAQPPPSLTVPAAPTVLPFHTFTCPLSAGDIRAISQRNAMRISCSALRSPWLPATVYPPPPPPKPQLNVGYVSSDFNNHPLAHLMQSVFGLHNPMRVRAICYATTPSDRSTHRRQIEREAPVFRDVSNWSPDRLAEQVTRDHVHILVNLNGYTRGARNEVFAARPAPIQMSFMGFAGSLGAEWCDYILADTTAIPPSTLRPWRSNVRIEDIFHDSTDGGEGEWMYSENIIFCRDTFFCCDHAQSCGSDEKGMTWKEEKRRRWAMRKELFPSLADEVVIMGNFNQLYKIEPTTFRSWLRILSRVSNAVLWLLRFPEPGESNLRATAEAWAGPEVASRLIFTDVAPKSQHISRARVCDLFLDTPECNAHTTAADVLWSSTPLLTLPRYPFKMCSRMAASVLRGALPQSAEGQRVARELIAEDEAQYERMAVELAGKLTHVDTGEKGLKEGRGRLAEMRQLLWDCKWRCGLFNTRRWVEDVESAYEESWRRWVDGVGGDIYL